MSAGAALQAAVVVEVRLIPELAGVFDGPPARAAFPYVTIDAGSESDWGHKAGEGREVLLAASLWDDQPGRIPPLADALEGAVLSVDAVAGWQLVSLVMLRRRIVRDVAGPWAAAIDFRARLLKL
jgi:Protein of unknown function (DUF3168)